ncbi:MFS transporter [Cellvibrio sp. OA-2007]|uniref:MFS transporter n=1 Tax=Cellvibrio sp. OA-2007 TaxID=529823 RepID=UPI000780D984|nr:MFS transporter [Cellvibrio sp. OA-2007]
MLSSSPDSSSPHLSREKPTPTFFIALLAMGLGSFAIGVGEFISMGLLPEISSSLGISIPQAGHTISLYALGVVIGAPVLAMLSTGRSRTRMLVVLMGLYAIANIASAMAPNYEAMLALRLLSGLPHGTFFGIASLVAATLAPSHMRTRAVAYVMLGLSTATLAGVPIATALGQWLGWRAAFVLVGVIALASAVCIVKFVPYEPPQSGGRVSHELSMFTNRQVWITLGIGAIGSGGLFAIYSYVKPTLMSLAGLTEMGVPFVLALFGAGMVTGNIFGSRMADRDLLGTIKRCLIWSMIVCGVFALVAPILWLACIAVFCVGTVVVIGPAVQIRLMDVAGKAQTMAAAMNHSAFNFANAAGAFFGGLVIDAGMGYAATGWVGVLLSAAGLAMFYWMVIDARRALNH